MPAIEQIPLQIKIGWNKMEIKKKITDWHLFAVG